MPESFYQEQLKKALNGQHKNAYEQVTVKGKPIGTGVTLGIFKEARRKRAEKAKIPYYSTKPSAPVLKKPCKHCKDDIVWDHKHSRKEFDARQFCNNQCKRLYYARPNN